MNIFEIKGKSSFINTVFENFRDEAKSSLTLYLKKRKKEITQSLSDCNLDQTTYDIITNSLINAEQCTLESLIHNYTKRKGISQVYHINDDNVDYLLDDCPESEDGIFPRPSLYVKCILEEYCDLPFIERERIFRSEIYNLVENACISRNFLKVKATYYNGKEINILVKPYKIVPDPLGTQSYLICKSCIIEENSNIQIKDNMRIASFTMYRLKKPRVLKSETFHFTSTEITEFEKNLMQISPAYFLYDSEDIYIRLTSNGKRAYRNKLYSRPIKNEAKSTEDIYAFTCSINQAYNYFFSFGKDAEIISPMHLREMFTNEYQKALNNYR